MILLKMLATYAVLSLLVLLPMLGARLTRDQSEDARLGAMAGGCLLAGVLVLSAYWFTFCTPPAGKGPVADKGRSIAAPVIAALETRHSRDGVYPESLGELALTDSLAVNGLRGDTVERRRDWWYRRTATGYELGFSYVGPAFNKCMYEGGGKAAKWSCYGYY